MNDTNYTVIGFTMKRAIYIHLLLKKLKIPYNKILYNHIKRPMFKRHFLLDQMQTNILFLGLVPVLDAFPMLMLSLRIVRN